jgi:glycerol-3-phosphate dehydrogenase
VRKTDLKGAAVWYDAIMTDSQRLLLEVIKWACSNGATALNYMAAEKLVATNGAVNGVTATDKDSGRSYSFQAPKVINAAGPWCRQLAGAFDRDIPRLFRPSLAFNTLFDRPAVSSHGLAIAPPTPDGRTYFLLPWKGRLLAGTGHAAWKDGSAKPEPTEGQLAEFLNDLNRAAPGLNFSIEEIVCTFAGLLPVKKDSGTDLTRRPIWIDHGKRGGPHGLYSVSGIKFTTARQVADRLLCRIYPQHQKSGQRQRSRELIVNCQNGDPNCIQTKLTTGFEKGVDHLKTLIAGESVRHLDDLVFRRTDLWENPIAALRMAPRMAGLFEWTDARRDKEIEQLVRILLRPIGFHFTKQ